MNSWQRRNPGAVIVVTGASSGIGRQTALRFAGLHARLALAARSEDSLQRVAQECLSAGAADVLVHVTDIAAQCAAITAFGRFQDIPAKVFDGIVRTNLLGSANVARSALIHFQAHGTGHLVLIGSLLSTAAAPYQSAYVATKFALRGLIRALRQENRHLPGIKVHGVYPGPVNTPVYGTASNYFGRTPRVPPTAVSPSTVVTAIIRATNRRRSTERQVGWFNRPAIVAYTLLPAAYDALIGALLRRVAFTSESAEPSDGNVFDQSPVEHAVP